MVTGLIRRFELFGSRRRTQILILLAMLEESYPAELARLLGARLFAVQTILAALESETIIVTRRLGRTRRVELNPRFIAYDELRALLWKLGEHDAELQAAAARKRGRPRRPDKPGGRATGRS
jgi:DNA-binding transcriptional ArsR family regulator